MATGNSPHGCEHEERVGSPSNNTFVGEDGCYGNTIEEQSGRERNVRRSKRATSEKNRPTQKQKRFGEEADQCSQQPPKRKKFKHSTPRQKRSCKCNFLLNHYVVTGFCFVLISVFFSCSLLVHGTSGEGIT